MTELDRKKVWWISRVPETSRPAKALVAEEPVHWQSTEALYWFEREGSIGERKERWIVARSAEGVERQHARLQRQAKQEQQAWAKRVRALEQRPCACEADALVACTQTKKGVPAFLEVTLQVEGTARHARRGRPRTGAAPELVWRVQGPVRVLEPAQDRRGQAEGQLHRSNQGARRPPEC